MDEDKEFYLYQKSKELTQWITDLYDEGYGAGHEEGYIKGRAAESTKVSPLEKPNRLFLYPEVLAQVMGENNLSAEDIAEASDDDLLKASTVKSVLEDEHRTRTATVLAIQAALRNILSEDKVKRVFRYV